MRSERLGSRVMFRIRVNVSVRVRVRVGVRIKVASTTALIPPIHPRLMLSE